MLWTLLAGDPLRGRRARAAGAAGDALSRRCHRRRAARRPRLHRPHGARAPASSTSREALSARWRAARCCRDSRSPSEASRDPYLVNQGKTARRRLRGRRPQHLHQRARPPERRHRRRGQSAESRQRQCHQGDGRAGRHGPCGGSMSAAASQPRDCASPGPARRPRRGPARASRTSCPCRACAPTSSSATAW